MKDHKEYIVWMWKLIENQIYLILLYDFEEIIAEYLIKENMVLEYDILSYEEKKIMLIIDDLVNIQYILIMLYLYEYIENIRYFERIYINGMIYIEYIYINQ